MTAASFTHLQEKLRHDFPEWLSPIIVRELRQGLRAHAFVGGLILLHALMATLFCMKLLNAAAEVDNVVLRNDEIEEWTQYGLLTVFLALQPLRALFSISEEQKASTLDLVQLTSLSSWQIVWGKWSALAGQTLLLAVSLLPYELLGYFMGGYELTMKALLWALLLGFSLGLTAYALALSSSGWLVRIVMLGPVGTLAWVFMQEIVPRQLSYVSSNFPLGALCFHGLWATLFSLAVAAKRVCAPVENSALWLRGIVLLQLLTGSCGGGWQLYQGVRSASAWWLMALPTVAWLCMEMMTETASPHASLYQPWMRRMRHWPRLRRLLYPGWWSGVRLLLLLTLVAGTVLFLSYRATIFDLTGVPITAWSWRNLQVIVLVHSVALGLSPALFFALLPSFKRQHWLYLASLGVVWVMGLMFSAILKKAEWSPELSAMNPFSALTWAGSHFYTLWYDTAPLSWGSPGGEALRHTAAAVLCYGLALMYLCWKGREEAQLVLCAEEEAKRQMMNTQPDKAV